MADSNKSHDDEKSGSSCDRYSYEEKLGIIAAVAKDTESLVCCELIEMLSLSLKDDRVVSFLNDNAIQVTYESIEDIPAKTNLRKDQEYALVAGLQLGVRADFCMNQIIKHYHNQQVMQIKNKIPASEMGYLNEITDEMVWEMIYRYFDLKTNNSLVAMLNNTVPRKVLREYMYGEFVNGIKIPEKRRILMSKIKRYYDERGIDVEAISNKDIKECLAFFTERGYDINRRDIMEMTRELSIRNIPLSSEAYSDVLDTANAGEIKQSTISLLDMNSAEDTFLKSQKFVILNEILNNELSSMEKAVIYIYHGFVSDKKISRKDLASYLGVELNEVMAIERKALKKIRNKILDQAPELAEFNYT
ncbi:hypothetical protein SAMN04487770_12331 [Butyrivibrio sp. ob235]|uniref:hypothetical protein n=1 Tax=Butyrivibrio sp. ob235 TaxID=1761780 RepID=UPI0008B09D59|nr:hypothetical protein [Butyrivibrio sp. ob235]SEM00708.1 hypothetical protein SAMN04487770_12331 [Butyrivibrio sp. ob235]